MFEGALPVHGSDDDTRAAHALVRLAPATKCGDAQRAVTHVAALLLQSCASAGRRFAICWLDMHVPTIMCREALRARRMALAGVHLAPAMTALSATPVA